MKFETNAEVARKADELIPIFEDLPLLVSFFPGAGIGPMQEDGSYPAFLNVTFGPKRVTFEGKVRYRLDAAQMKGVMSGSAVTNFRGAKMSCELAFDLKEQAGSTHIAIASNANLTGMLAEFASTGGAALANALLNEFVKNMERHLQPACPPAAHTASDPSAESTMHKNDSPKALSAFRLLGIILMGKLRALLKRA